jgi:hypothetical protein
MSVNCKKPKLTLMVLCVVCRFTNHWLVVMINNKNKIAALISALLFTANAVYAQSADALARDAIRRLDEFLGGETVAASTAPQSAPPVQSMRGGQEPGWVADPYVAYSRDRYLAAVGFAPNRAEAEKKALAALTAIFGQSIQADFSVATAYSEAVSKGIVSSSETTNIRDRISTSMSLDTLIGAEIGSVWDNARGTVYALAYLDKERAVAVYGNMILTNLKNVEKLTAMTAAEKNTLDGYARYKLAAIISGIRRKERRSQHTGARGSGICPIQGKTGA